MFMALCCVGRLRYHLQPDGVDPYAETVFGSYTCRLMIFPFQRESSSLIIVARGSDENHLQLLCESCGNLPHLIERVGRAAGI